MCIHDITFVCFKFTLISENIFLLHFSYHMFKGQMASISCKGANNLFSDYWSSSSNKPFPFHLDWYQYAHILCNHFCVGCKTSHSEASHRKNKPFQRFFTGNRCFSEIQVTCPLTWCNKFTISTAHVRKYRRSDQSERVAWSNIYTVNVSQLAAGMFMTVSMNFVFC